VGWHCTSLATASSLLGSSIRRKVCEFSITQEKNDDVSVSLHAELLFFLLLQFRMMSSLLLLHSHDSDLTMHEHYILAHSSASASSEEENVNKK
jgi:hypothetical protein